MGSDIERPSHEEYVDTVGRAFGFLKHLGYREQWDARNKFRVAFTKGDMVVRVWGWGYGESGHASVELDGEDLPFHECVTPYDQVIFTEPTGKPPNLLTVQFLA